MDRDLACPRCQYNLRTQREPRCPECGDAFRWQDILHIECPRCSERLAGRDDGVCGRCGLIPDWRYLLGGAPRAADMFEYSSRPLSRFLPTCAAALLPRRFWRRFALEMTPNVPRLRAFRRMAIVAGLLGLAAYPAIVAAYALYFFHVLQPNRYALMDHLRYLDPEWFTSFTTCVSLMLPTLTWLILPRFTPTLARFRTRPDQLLRCFAYSSTALFWLGFAALIDLGLQVWIAIHNARASGLTPWDFWVDPSLRLLTYTLPVLAGWWLMFLYVALRKYLRLDTLNALALLMSTQGMAALITLLLSVLWSIALLSPEFG